jgi:hypothetical protein
MRRVVFFLSITAFWASVAFAELQPADLATAALERTKARVTYDPAYVAIAYPMGDVREDRGVCADVIVRAYRKLGLDLQQAVHEDMRTAFSAYPKIWGLSAPDANIDHRRVANLKTFFKRAGAERAISLLGSDYMPGDVVTWELAPGRHHIGVVTEKRSSDGLRPLIVHNIGAGPKLEDMLFKFKVTGRYHYYPGGASAN